MRVLFTSVGRRVSLLKAFREVLQKEFGKSTLIAGDISHLAPARLEADESFDLPGISVPSYPEVVLHEALQRNVQLVVPLIDPDVLRLSAHQEDFANSGIALHTPNHHVASLTHDKLMLSSVLLSHSLHTPVSRPLSKSCYESDEVEFAGPVIVKPQFGSGSTGVTFHSSLKSAHGMRVNFQDLIVQPRIVGDEFSLDMYVAKEGHVMGAVVRKQLVARSGEVAVGKIVRNPTIESLAYPLVNLLKGAWGIMHTDIIVDKATGIPYILDVNCRFPGGFILSHTAGAPFIEWLAREASGAAIYDKSFKIKSGLTMLRYDSEIYIDSLNEDGEW